MRSEMVRSCRVLFASGLADSLGGFVAVRDPSGDGVWVTRDGVGFDEVGVDDVQLVPLDGDDRSTRAETGGEIDIAAAIMTARADVDAVVHVHSLHATAFSAVGRSLDALSHEGCHLVPPDVARWRGGGATSDARGVAAAIAQRNAVLLAGHGQLTAAATLGEAVALAVYLEKACQLQLMVGPQFHGAGDEEVSLKRSGQMARPIISWEYLRRTTTIDDGALS